MPRRSLRLPVLAALALVAGCGTLDNVQRPAVPPPTNPGAPVCRAYGGVRGDWASISEYPWERTTNYLDYVTIPVLAGVDLFFAFVGDTVTLPYTAYAEIRRALGGTASEVQYLPELSAYPMTDTAPPPPAPVPASYAGR